MILLFIERKKRMTNESSGLSNSAGDENETRMGQ
jgi:hypothetical protein